MGRKYLVIPDAHARPNEDLRRFDWLGELILWEMPDVIIEIGDWYDMEALSSYDKGLKSFEGRRYKDDIASGHEAERRSFGRIVEYNDTATRHKKKHYRPIIKRTRGNHEQRIIRAIERQPELDGVISISDTNCSLDLDIISSPFLTPILSDGIALSHYFVSGIMGKPLSSAHLILQKHFMSSISGHQHTLDWAGGTRADGQRMQSLICGMYLDPSHMSSYMSHQAEGLCWSGLHILHGVNNGDYDREEYSVKRLEKLMTKGG